MNSFVKTPSGTIMHVDNHRNAVEAAKACGLKGALMMLEPAEPLPDGDPAAFFGIDRSVAEEPASLQWAKEQPPLTAETFREAAAKMLTHKPRPPIELHAPSCPKIATKGQLACRCGAAPIEAAIEDEKINGQ